ncbi:MAG: hypothetical protein IKP06_04775 [Elusimicrobiaceae bacterium]|nr:hypothetical protein [Elusimicrobiaceae bacterium]
MYKNIGGIIFLLLAVVYPAFGQVPASTGARVARSTQQVTTAAESLGKVVSEAVFRSISQGGTGQFKDGVFCGRAKKGESAWSGSVFAVEENGERKIYGVIAAHSLALLPTDLISGSQADYSLHRTFKLEMLDKTGTLHTSMGEVVWLSSPKMWDMALVKFSPWGEHLFTPFELSDKLPALGDIVEQQGFSKDLSVYVPNRQVIDITPLSFRTTMLTNRLKRVGLCGSPVFIEEESLNETSVAKLVGIHTGSSWSKGDIDEDIGYFTPVTFLKKFVEDYQTGGQVRFPVELKGREAISLAADEYIHAVILFDNEGHEITRHKFEEKFSHRKLESLVDLYGPFEIDFVVKRFQWAHVNPEYVEFSKGSHRIRYNLREGQIVKEKRE